MNTNGVRFVRINGRVVPIKQSNTKSYIAQGVAGAVIGGLHTVAVASHKAGMKLGNGRALKFGRKVGLAAMGLNLAAEVYSVKKATDIKGTAGDKFKEYLKHLGSRVLGATIGGAATAAPVMYNVKLPRKAFKPPY
jgi:hypothetical protein